MSDGDGLPKGWCWATTDRLFTFVTSGSRGWAKYYSERGPSFLRIGNLDHASISLDVEKIQYVTPPRGPEAVRTRVQPGDLLISITADVGMVALVPQAVGEAYINQHIALSRPTPLTCQEYLAWYLASESGGQLQFKHFQRGATKAGLGLDDIKSVRVPLAPLLEQRRIVAKIEELFSDLDAGVAALERAKANLKRYRAAVLKAAVEGRLTEAWRADHFLRPPGEGRGEGIEPASQLLQRILAQRRRKWQQDQLAKYQKSGKKPPPNWKSKYKEPASPDTSNLPELPEGWCWATVEQVTCYVRNGLSKKPSQTPPGYRILRINAVRPMAVDLAEVRYYDRPSEEIEGYFVQNGDLLFTRYNGSVNLLGVAGMVRGCEEATLHPDKLIRVKTVLPYPLPDYVEIASNVGESRKHMSGRARTTAGQTGISGADIREMPIPFCSLDEQKEILREVESRLSLVHAAASIVAANVTRAARLRQSILKRAFEGKLVPQDPTDEPATKLLERIKTARPIPGPKGERRNRPRRRR